MLQFQNLREVLESCVETLSTFCGINKKTELFQTKSKVRTFSWIKNTACNSKISKNMQEVLETCVEMALVEEFFIVSSSFMVFLWFLQAPTYSVYLLFFGGWLQVLLVSHLLLLTQYLCIRYLLRLFDCLAHPNLGAPFATDQK